MIVHLALSVALALLSAGGLLDPATTDVTNPATAAVVGAADATAVADSTPPADGADAAGGDVQVTQVDVVVPVVDPSGEVVATPELSAADEAPQALAADAVEADGRVASEVLETDGFQTLGVTWPEGSDVGGLEPAVRTRDLDGTWSDWQALEIADEAPDAGSADARSAELRGGTDPLWVGEADAVQVSFAASADAAPGDLNLTLVDAPAAAETGAVVGGASSSGQAVIAPAAYVVTDAQTATPAASSSGPTVITRAAWGARAQACTPNVATALVGAVIHHTAGSNSYATVAQAAQQIRGDQAYHIDGRGWCDIGYNFLVDKWGNIYEGRANSLTSAVVGVHAGGFNTGSLGVSMLGSYDSAPSAATQQAVAQIVGWRLGAYGINPQGSMTYRTLGGENSSVPANTTVTLPAVIGHRDVAYTACPGNGGYSALPAIRAMAASFSYDQRFVQAKAVVRALYADLLGRGVDPTGLATWSTRLAGGTSQAALVTELTRSDEYINLRVAQAYREVLGREPEPLGAANWLIQIKLDRATVDDVARRFFDSQEFVNRSGGTTEGYVAAMYRAILGRDATAGEVSTWSTKYEATGRGWVVDQIWFSTEAAKNRAGAYYRVFLQREPDAAGLAGWATELLTRGEGAVRTGIAGSEEYRSKALVRYPETSASA